MRFPAPRVSQRCAHNTIAALHGLRVVRGADGVGVSIPLQFLADKHLARAVWQHNARYAVETR